MLLIVCPLIFLAGFIDAAAGGGGLISLPAYLAAGLPPHFAYGTNKFASCVGTLVSTTRFYRSGTLHLRAALCAAAGALAGSFGGSQLALRVDDRYLQLFILCALPVAALFVLCNRRFGEVKPGRERLQQNIPLAVLIGLVIGAYDGFFGPGTGTFLIFAYTGLMGFDLRTASGNAKLVNLSSNIAALLSFIPAGKVLYSIALPAAVCSIAGNYLGAGMAIRRGGRFIRALLVVVLVLLFLRIGSDFLGPLLADA